MKKLIAILLSLVLCFSFLAACGEKEPDSTNGPSDTQGNNGPSDTQGNEDPGSDKTEGKTIVLSEYFGKDVWEDDGGDVTVSADQILFDNGYMGDFAALRLTETFQNVNLKFSLQLEDVPTDLTEDEGTYWDAELMIMLRSSLAAPGWEDGQTGYSLTAWGDMSVVYIGRAGHDDAFGSVEWPCNDGQPHSIEFSAENNEDNTVVHLKLVVDGNVLFEKDDDGSITKEGRTPLFPDAGGVTIRCKYVKAIVK